MGISSISMSMSIRLRMVLATAQALDILDRGCKASGAMGQEVEDVRCALVNDLIFACRRYNSVRGEDDSEEACTATAGALQRLNGD